MWARSRQASRQAQENICAQGGPYRGGNDIIQTATSCFSSRRQDIINGIRSNNSNIYHPVGSAQIVQFRQTPCILSAARVVSLPSLSWVPGSCCPSPV